VRDLLASKVQGSGHLSADKELQRAFVIYARLRRSSSSRGVVFYSGRSGSCLSIEQLVGRAASHCMVLV